MVKECPDFPKAIRGEENLKLGVDYIKIYSHMNYKTKPLKLMEIKEDKFGKFMIFATNDSMEKKQYLSDGGIDPYLNGKWN